MSFNQRSLFARTGLSIAVAMSVFAVSSVAQAEEVYDLGEIVVTAARTSQTVDETLAPVTVINRAQIERSQATTVTELLNQAPGVQITSSGGPGSTSGVYIRGTRTAQSLILVDGHKINSGSSGTAPLEYLDPDQIERIEIVRGPRSTLYGADALGGVINIITKKGSGDPSLTVKVGGGSRSAGEYGLNFNGESDGTQFNLGARIFETQGFDRTINQLGSDGDDDAFRNKSFSGSVSKSFNNGVDAGINFFHSEGKTEYDNGYDKYGIGSTHTGYPIGFFEMSSLNTYLSTSINDNWDASLDLGFVSDKRDDVGGSSGARYTKSKRYSVSLVNDIVWLDNQLLTTGLDYSDEDVQSSSKYSSIDNTRYNIGVFAQNLSSFDRNDFQIGGRYDKNELYGNKTTGNISWGIDLPKDMRFVASYGTAFRAPTVSDLHSNPDLKPESSKNAEVELRGQFGANTDWAINVYHNDMTNMLLWNTVDMENTDAKISGIEFSGSTILKNWMLSSSVSFIEPEYSTGLNKGKTLYRRATELFSLNADKDFGRWTLGGTFRAQGSTWNDQPNTEAVSGFGTIDLRATVRLTQELKTQFKVVNIMDKEYTTTKGYVDEPRGVFATFIWSPEL